MPRSFALALSLCAAAAWGQTPDCRFSAAGYFRIAARPDFQGGNGRLGFWNLSGRLMNEGSYAALELKLDLLQAAAGSADFWASLHTRVEGSSVANADPGNGSLVNFRLSQLYARAGNLIAPDVVWQLGTLQYFFGDLGLYDLRPAQLLEDTIGLSARWQHSKVDVLLAVGDSGFAARGAAYVPLLTAGGAVRVRLGQVEFGGGGQVAVEPFIAGNKNSSYVTPGVRYEDFVRREVLRRYLEANPGGFDDFALPQQASQLNTSWRVVGYLGFGDFGPVRWNNFFVRYQRLHPQGSYVDSWQGRAVTVYSADLTRDRYALQLGDELQLRVIKNRLDVVWAGLYGTDRDYANTLQASEANRVYASTVLRAQVYLTKTVHLLFEGSLATERSLNGNLYRTAFDSIFTSSAGRADARGLEYGDAATRDTVQLKAGVVLNPTGFGVFARPSIRLLYGAQYSTVHAAFGNAFVDRLDQFDAFKPTTTLNWHHLVSLETEGWF